MTAQEDALSGIASFLDRLGVRYMIIGGIANLVWGEPRATLDVDVTVLVPADEIDGFIDAVGLEYQILPEDARRFVRDTRVLPVAASNGIRIDLIFGLLPFEEEAVGRAIAVTVSGASVRICTAEDLILMKAISERDRDLADAQSIVRRRLQDLDLDYLEPRLREMAVLLERDEILSRWRQWKREAGA